ncbi:WD40 repeat domain-containing protein [Streptomyces sp. NPDC059788]|uniref:WD40 repeat domain-containing protein n=1 Tax=Streptomyces sp. NPDC059788 TaxID=3346948 RepID=UPI003658A3B1
MAVVAAIATACAAAVLPPVTAQARSAPGAASTVRVSTTSDGTQADGLSDGASISADGQYVAFWSAAPNLGADHFRALLIKDLASGQVTRVPGARTYGGSYTAISADGRYVGYASGTRYPSAYVYDRLTGRSSEASRSELSSVDSLSADGRFAAVTVGNRNPSRPAQLRVRDLVDGTDEQIDPQQTPTGHPSVGNGSLSGDGRLLAFATGPRSGAYDIFVKDRTSGAVQQVDVPLDGVQDEKRSSLVAISRDGRYVLFQSESANLVPGTTGPGLHSYLRDLRTGSTVRLAPAGVTAAAVSGDGRKVLLSEDGRLSLLDVCTGDRAEVGPAARALPGSVTGSGEAVAFTSESAVLVPGDTNAVADVFVHRPPR